MATVNVTEITQIPQGCLPFPLSTSTPWNHPEDLVSRSVQQKFKEIIDVYVLTPLFFLFLPLNIINMVVFWKHGIKERINVCLFFLSLSDIIVIAIHFVLKLDRLYATMTNSPYVLVVAKYVMNYMAQSLICSVYLSGFLNTLIALERCLCVVSPLKAQGMLKTKTMAGIIAVGSAVILGLFCIIISRWRVVCLFDPLTGYSVDNYYPSQFYMENKTLVDFFNGIVFGIFLPGIFVLGVSVSTVIIIVKLRQMSEWRQQSSAVNVSDGSAAKDMTLTRMLIGTSILFVACTIPHLTFHMTLLFVPELSLSGKYYNTYYLFVTIQQLCSYINSSFNFFVYYYFGTKFRMTVKRMFALFFNTQEK
ncbi:hypothetical protein ACOMHN_033765 [Nucella lapillus]